jgi:hypothetical protein
MKIENVIFDLSVDMAERLGMRTVHFLGRESIEEIYSAIGVDSHGSCMKFNPMVSRAKTLK